MESVIDKYVAQVSEPALSTFQAVRDTIHELVPGLEECISYGIPAFRVSGGVVAGIAVNRQFCSYYPFSGSVLDEVGDVIAGYSRTKSALHFAHDEALPAEIIQVLVEARIAQLATG